MEEMVSSHARLTAMEAVAGLAVLSVQEEEEEKDLEEWAMQLRLQSMLAAQSDQRQPARHRLHAS
jgi:hypothetical protein